MAKQILITKEKGGVASTTTAVNLAYDLASRENSVLLVDMDTRGDCAPCLGLDPRPGLQAVMRGALERAEGAVVGDGLEVARPRLHLIPTNTSGLLDVLQKAEQLPLRGLANLLSDMGEGYDYVLFDTSAASGKLRQAAMCVADLMVIPTRVEALGMPDIASLIVAFRQAQGKPYGKPKQVLILPVAVRRRIGVHEYNLGLLRTEYAGRVTDEIPDRVAVIESHSAMQPVLEYAPSNDASIAYRRFTDRGMRQSILRPARYVLGTGPDQVWHTP